MKKFLTVGLIIFALIMIGIVVFVFATRSKPEEMPVLVFEQGTVEYKLTEQETYTILAEEELDIPSGSFIKTAEKSYARVFFPDNSLVSIDENSEIQINYTGNTITIDQFIGKTWNRVETLVKGGQYKVETPNTIAAVRGTIFGVGVDNDDNSRVFVEESNVDVSKYNEDKATLLETVNLAVNELANIKKEQQDLKILKQNTPDDFKQTLWYKRNKIVDDEYLNLRKLFGGRELRKRILEKLRQRGDFEDLRLGYKDIGLEGLKNRIQALQDLVKINQETCEKYSQEDILQAIYQLRKYSKYINKADEVEQLLRELYQTCQDGKINLDEAQKIEALVDIINPR